RRLGAAELLHQLVDRRTALERLVNPRFLGFSERTVHVREDRQLRVLLIKLANRRTNRFDATTSPLSKPTRNLRLAPASRSQAASPIDNVLPLLLCQLTEPGPASDAFLVALHKAVSAAPEQTNPLAAVKHKAATDQSQLSPTRDSLGRNIELLGQF